MVVPVSVDLSCVAVVFYVVDGYVLGCSTTGKFIEW